MKLQFHVNSNPEHLQSLDFVTRWVEKHVLKSVLDLNMSP